MTRIITGFGFSVAVLFGLLARGPAAEAASTIQWKVLTDLDRFEPFDAMVFNGGRLWVGRSRNGLGAEYKLEIFDSAGTRLSTQPLTHSLRYMYPHGANGVLTVGVSVQTQLTHFTTIASKGTAYQLQAKQIPLGAFGNEFAGQPGALYFTDPGGLDDGSPLNQALRTIFTFTGSRPRYLAARIRGPFNPVFAAGALYVIENPSLGAGGRNLIRVDLKTEATTKLYSGTDIANVLAFNAGKLLALADRGAGEVVIVDTNSGKVTQRLTVPAGTPRGLASLGHCLVVGSEQAKKVTFFDLRTNKSVGEWDLSVAGNKLFGLRSIAADPATGRVYARSAYPDSVVSPSQDVDRNSVVMAEETGGETLRACK